MMWSPSAWSHCTAQHCGISRTLQRDKRYFHIFIRMTAVGCVVQILFMTVISPRLDLVQALHWIAKICSTVRRTSCLKNCFLEKSSIRLRALPLALVSWKKKKIVKLNFGACLSKSISLYIFLSTLLRAVIKTKSWWSSNRRRRSCSPLSCQWCEVPVHGRNALLNTVAFLGLYKGTKSIFIFS